MHPRYVFAYLCHVMYASCGSTHMEVHISLKQMCVSTRLEGARIELNLHVLTFNNLLTMSNALHYTNLLLVDQNNVMHHLETLHIS